LVSCGSKSETGVVGESITLIAETLESSEDLDIVWEIDALPDASWLTIDAVQLSEDLTELVFVPDEPGEYSFKVTFSQYGDEISSQIFTYEIEDDGLENQDESRPEVTEEEWLATPIDTPEAEPVDTEIAMEPVPVQQDPPVVKPVVKKTPPPSPPKKQIIPGSKIPFDKDRFTIQVASRNKLVDAERVAADLIDAGFDAYIQKAYFIENDQTWYRVRVGSYDNIDVAKSVAESIANAHELTTWIDHVRIEQ